jgi:hypothetical protein
MPSYIFEIEEDGQTEPGDLLELASNTAAREEAMRAVGEIMSSEMPNGDSKLLEVHVRQAEGARILTVRLRLDTVWHVPVKDCERH